ncbi:MAG: hypothetical protein CM15mP117_21720 [Alphaproteobacteria bacterium]|nr:MAG: hypothetical protein CM15mP117_21720 [Alphaproteobacteria bacterium]
MAEKVTVDENEKQVWGLSALKDNQSKRCIVLCENQD